MIAPVQTYPNNGQRPARVQTWDPNNAHLGDSPDVDTSIGDRVTQTVGSYPIAAIAAAAVVGIVAGWLVKRKF